MKKRNRDCEGDKPNKRIYNATTISKEVKTFSALMFLELRKDGMTMEKYLMKMSNIGYNVADRTFERYLQSVRTTDSALKDNDERGAKSLLTNDEKMIASGWVIEMNDNGKIVLVKHYKKFVFDTFGVDISITTAHAYLHEAGFSSRTTKNKNNGFKFDTQTLIEILWTWVNEMRIKNIWSWAPSKLCSIDFLYTGHRTDRRTTFTQTGSAQPVADISISNYTNTIITCIWADGKNRTPPILFTYNPAFKLGVRKSKIQEEKYNRLIELLGHYEIGSKRVVYLENNNNESKHFVSESPELLRLFFQRCKVKKNCLILSDNGNAFYEKGESVLLKIGFDIHRTYPAAVHQWLSPNDNHLHGSSKASWRQSDVNFKDDVSSSLMLLNHLDSDIISYSKHWFNRNMIKLEEDGVEGLIGNVNIEKSKYKRDCMDVYRNFINNNNNNT